MLSMTRPLLDVENNRVRRKTFGREGSFGERGGSGPKNITVGCVIFTVPRRQSVSQAFTAEMPKASTEIAIETGSTMRARPFNAFAYEIL